MVSYIHDSYQTFKKTGKKAAAYSTQTARSYGSNIPASDASVSPELKDSAAKRGMNKGIGQHSTYLPFWKRFLILARDTSRPAWPMLFFIAFYLVTFTILERADWPAYDYTVIHLRVDDLIPFCEVFVVPYLLWFPFMIVNMAYFYVFDEDTYKRTAKMLYIGMSLFLLVSLLFPNVQHLRPSVMPRDNIFTHMVAALYRADTPTNICPSIHVYNSLVIMIGVHKCRHFFLKDKPAIRWSMYILGCLIIASTMLIKQHSVFDVLCAFALIVPAYAVSFRNSAAAAAAAAGGAGNAAASPQTIGNNLR